MGYLGGNQASFSHLRQKAHGDIWGTVPSCLLLSPTEKPQAAPANERLIWLWVQCPPQLSRVLALPKPPQSLSPLTLPGTPCTTVQCSLGFFKFIISAPSLHAGWAAPATQPRAAGGLGSGLSSGVGHFGDVLTLFQPCFSISEGSDETLSQSVYDHHT